MHNIHLLIISVYYALQCATTTQIKLLTLAHCSLYASYATLCASSACRAVEQLSCYWPDTMGVDHGGQGVQVPPEFGVGETLRQIVPLRFRHIQCESKKVAPLKLFAIFSLRLSIFP